MDPEIRAMIRIEKLLRELPDDARDRIIGYLADRYLGGNRIEQVVKS